MMLFRAHIVSEDGETRTVEVEGTSSFRVRCQLEAGGEVAPEGSGWTIDLVERIAECPKDSAHRTARALDLTVAGCPGSDCSSLRDRATVAGCPFGRETDEVLAAIGRLTARSRRLRKVAS